MARTGSVATPDRAAAEREIPEGTSRTTQAVAEPTGSRAAAITPTMTTVTTSGKRVRSGSHVLHLTARVTSRDRGVTGSVTFWDGTAMLGSARLDDSGRAELAVTALSPGQHLLTARFPGHGGYAASGSLPILIVVSP